MDAQRARSAFAPTGDSRVDAAVQRLAALEDVDVGERSAVLEEVHNRLRQILGELGEPDGSAPARPGERGEQAELSGALRPGGSSPRPGPPRPGVPGPGSWPRPHA